MFFRINWFATIGGGQGYSGSSEQTAVALNRRKDVDLNVISFNKVPAKNISRAGKKLKEKPFMLGDVGVAHGFPSCFNSLFPDQFRVGYTMFETDKLPDGHTPWTGDYDSPAEAINTNLDLLLTPSQFCVDVFKKAGVTVPIEVIPNGVNPRQLSYIERPKRKTFTFLMLATLTLRKNPGSVISAFSALFRDNPDVKLVLKTQSGTLGHMQFNKDMGNIEVIDKTATMAEIKQLYADADCFVFPSRGEGFGMPPLEAMATGLPTIVADNTGMREYANDKYNYVIEKNTLVPAERYPKSWGDVGNWFEPDYQELKDLMWHVYTHQDEARAKGKLAAEWIAEEWNYDEIADKIVMAIQKHNPKLKELE